MLTTGLEDVQEFPETGDKNMGQISIDYSFDSEHCETF